MNTRREWLYEHRHLQYLRASARARPRRELAQRQAPRGLEQFPLDLDAVAEEQHDQGDDRERGHEARRGPGLHQAKTASAGEVGGLALGR